MHSVTHAREVGATGTSSAVRSIVFFRYIHLLISDKSCSNAWLGWPIQELPHACLRYRQGPELDCARRAFASLHATSSTRDRSWGAHLLWLQSPLTQIPDTDDVPHSLPGI